MLNSHLNDYAPQTHLTQCASYFDIIDNAVKTGDTNKRYQITTNTSTGPSPPISPNHWTNVHLAPTCDNMCDLYNSFIEVDMEFRVKLNGTKIEDTSALGRNPAFWVGFKDSMDAVSSYIILSNGTGIYNQSHAIEESYITNLACPDAVKKRDVFSKAVASKIQRTPESVVTGQLIEIKPADDWDKSWYNCKLHLKIDFRRFLPLSGIRYLPAFVGNLELRLQFSLEGLVVLPMPWTDIVSKPSLRSSLTTIDNITTCFRPATESFKMYQKYDSSNKHLIADTYQCQFDKVRIVACNSILANFGIDDAIYRSLVQRYTGQSLSFPTQTLTFQAMNGVIDNSKVDLALTSTPRFIDTIFLLFPENPSFRTCFVNPLFDSMQLTMGGYGSIPDIAVSSYGSINYEILTNSLNANNDLTGLSKDVMRSAILDPALKKDQQIEGLEANDVSNFVIAFPTSVDNTFQQGQTSSAPITYQFKATLNENSRFIKPASSKTGTETGTTTPTEVHCAPIMGFLKDSVFAIQLRPAGPPIIALDEFDIASPSGN